MSGQARCEWYVFAVPELGNSRCTPPWSSSVYTQLHHAFAQPHQASLFCTHADIILSLTLRQVHSTNQSNYYLLQGNRGTKCGSSQGDLKKICSGRGRGRRPKLSWSQADRILRALKLAPRMTCCRRSFSPGGPRNGESHMGISEIPALWRPHIQVCGSHRFSSSEARCLSIRHF